MRIITCYVENFGKLSQFTFDFNQGLTIIEEENGWGKTTLAAFIKAMFYGLEYSRGKKLTDRKHYSPWNGSRFGGYLVFEKDGIKYKIERFFGRTPKTDTITVYNMHRNTKTDELGDNPGESIWKVDRDSYEKTAFITLENSSLLNDLISSKLGNIKEQEADLETSSKVVDLLDKEMVRIKAKRGKSGLIGQKEKSLFQLKQEVRQHKNSLEKIGQSEDWIKKEKEELNRVTNQIKRLEEAQSKLVLYEKKQQYIDIRKDFKTSKKEYNEKNVFFKYKNLSEEELNSIKDEASDYIHLTEQAKTNKLQKAQIKELEGLRKIFLDSIPELKELDSCNKKINRLSNLAVEREKYTISPKEEKRFHTLDARYKNTSLDQNTMDQYLDNLNQVSELRVEENKLKNEIERLKQKRTDKNTKEKKLTPLFFLGLLFSIGGIILISQSFLIGSLAALLGLLIIVLSFTLKSKNDKKAQQQEHISSIESLGQKLEEMEKEKESLSQGYNHFIETFNESPSNIASFLANSKVDIVEYNRLKDEIKSNSLKREKVDNELALLKNEIEGFLGKYYHSLEKNSYSEILSELRNNLYRYQDLSKAQTSYKEIRQRVASSKERLEDKLQYYYPDFPPNISKAVEELTRNYYALERAKNKLEDSKKKKDKFEAENNLLKLDELNLADREKNPQADHIGKQKNALNEKENDLIKKIERHKKDISLLIQEVDKIEDVESEITQLEKDIRDLQKKHDLLTLTKDCMIEAKENLAEKYLGDMSSSFKKYLTKLNNNRTDYFHIDIDLNVKVEHGGKLYSGNRLSKGMKDLVQLCLRMALVEAVYKEVDNPILVLDDPFINLDDQRLENAMALLKTISSDYQIIYFICHSSRNIKNFSESML